MSEPFVRKLTEEDIEAMRQAVMSEAGAQLCWHDMEIRDCDAEGGPVSRPCRCREVACAALSPLLVKTTTDRAQA